MINNLFLIFTSNLILTLLIICLLLIIIGFNNKIYRDVKADYKGTAKGHFTIKPFLFTDWLVAKQHISNYCDYFNDIIPNHPQYQNLCQDEKNNINEDFKNLLQLKIKINKNIKSKDIKKTILDCNKILISTYINPIYTKLNIHFTIATDLDINEEYINNILPLITIDSNIFDIDILFPKNNKIDHKVYKQKIIKIIETMFPEPIRSKLLSNYNKLIENYDK